MLFVYFEVILSVFIPAMELLLVWEHLSSLLQQFYVWISTPNSGGEISEFLAEITVTLEFGISLTYSIV